MTDPAALRLARSIVRQAYVTIGQIRTTDHAIPDLMRDLDGLCIDLTNIIAAEQCELPLPVIVRFPMEAEHV